VESIFGKDDFRGTPGSFFQKLSGEDSAGFCTAEGFAPSGMSVREKAPYLSVRMPVRYKTPNAICKQKDAGFTERFVLVKKNYYKKRRSIY